MGIETMAMLSLGTTLASGAVGAIGAASTASANREMAEYQAAVARNNQVIANQNAEAAATAGDVAAANEGMKGRAAVGAARAAGAASGLDVNTGTTYDLQVSADQLHLLDAATIRHNAAKTAYGYRAQALGFGAEAGLRDMAVRNASTAGNIGVASSLLGSATSFSDKWMTMSHRRMI